MTLAEALKQSEYELEMNTRLATAAFADGDYRQASEADAKAASAKRDIRRLKIEIEMGRYR